MPMAKIKQKGQVTIPAAMRSALALEEGDYVEVTSDGRTIVLTPKAMVDRDPVADAAIEEALDDLEHGRVTPAFASARALVDHLERHDAGDED